MREKILIDHGNPSIKEKVLDLLTKLEAESRDMRDMMGLGEMPYSKILKKKQR